MPKKQSRFKKFFQLKYLIKYFEETRKKRERKRDINIKNGKNKREKKSLLKRCLSIQASGEYNSMYISLERIQSE